MTDQIITGNRYSKVFPLHCLHRITPHLTDLFSGYSGTHATLALTRKQHHPRNGRNGKKIYVTASGRFLPFFSFERKKKNAGCSESQKQTGTAHQLSPSPITLKIVQP
jgi:hypothetical protein